MEWNKWKQWKEGMEWKEWVPQILTTGSLELTCDAKFAVESSSSEGRNEPSAAVALEKESRQILAGRKKCRWQHETQDAQYYS